MSLGNFILKVIIPLLLSITITINSSNTICLLKPTITDGMRFYLYTKNKMTNITMEEEYVQRLPFVNNNRFSIFIHGYTAHYDDNYITIFRNAYLNGTADQNIILVDYSSVTGNISQTNYGQLPMGYIKSVQCDLPKVAKQITNFVEMIRKVRSDLSDIHLIGHSLGAHIAFQVGKFYSQSTGRLLSRITALDPAGPWFESSSKPNTPIARFVDVVHTNIGILGYTAPLGTVDYYINNGVVQTGCLGSVDQKMALGCSHLSAVFYYAESINNKRILAKSCYEIKDIVKDKKNLFVINGDNNNAISLTCDSTSRSISHTIVFGEHVPLDAVGVYFISIPKVPFYD